MASLAATSAKSDDFRGFFQEHFGYVWKTLERLGVPQRDLEDVCHDLFVTVYRKQHERDAERPARPWLCAFAYRFASDYRRAARQRYEEMPDDGVIEAELGSAPENRLERRDLSLRALEDVALDRRVVFVMHDIDGYTAQEIADELAIPLNTAYSRLRLARQEFKGAVARLTGGTA